MGEEISSVPLSILPRVFAGSESPPSAQPRQQSSKQASLSCKPKVEIRGQLKRTVILGAPRAGAGAGAVVLPAESPLFCGAGHLVPLPPFSGPPPAADMATPLGLRPSLPIPGLLRPKSDTPGAPRDDRKDRALLSKLPLSSGVVAAAKSLQSCPTLSNPIDGSPPGSRPWDSPGKNTGVGCHFLLQCMKVKTESEVSQSCPTLSDPMDCSLPGSSAHGIFQARVLEWVAIAFSIWGGRFPHLVSSP